MTDEFSSLDHEMMAQTLSLAEQGQGRVEPNPMVGSVIVARGQVVGRGWHPHFGGPHAEVQALADAGEASRDATMYVSLEPCCHHGKTPPCVEAILRAGIRRVVVAMRDPFPQVDGGGVNQLRDAGVDVELGLLEEHARSLNAPYLKRVRQRRPWLIAKWAMTLDGKLASRTGSSKWISNSMSRALVHQIRGRMDAVIVGRGTSDADDPLLTARPPGPRVALRVVLDSRAALSVDSQLVQTALEVPVMVVVGKNADPANCQRLQLAGCEVLQLAAEDRATQLTKLLDELGSREMTNVLVEGGSHVLGSAFDAALIDEVHVFIATKLVGGDQGMTPIGGIGLELMTQAQLLGEVSVEQLGSDVHISGRIGSSIA